MGALFDRVVLLFALRDRPRGFIDAGELVPLAPTAQDPFEVVVESLRRLAADDLIQLRPRKRVQYRRTAAGLARAEALFANRRVSFGRAIEGSEELAPRKPDNLL
jgi:hypothetical protein